MSSELGWMGGQGLRWEQGAAPARQCQRPGAHGGGRGGRALGGAEPRAGAAPRCPPHSPLPGVGHPAPRLAARPRAPQPRRTVPGHGGRRARQGPGCGQRRTATGRGPPPVGYTDTGRDMRGHARTHAHRDHSHGHRPHGGEETRENRHRQRGTRHRERGDMRQSPVCYSAQVLSHPEGPQLEPSNNLPLPHSSQPLLDHHQPQSAHYLTGSPSSS